MKRYMLILLFSVLLAGCLPVVYVEFKNPNYDSGCWIHVDSDNNQPIFHTQPGGGIVSVTEAMALPPDINDEDDYVIINAYFSVLRYAVAADGYWFEVNIEGLRYIEGLIVDLAYFSQSSDPTFPFYGIPGETIYEEEGDIATGTYWIPENQVANMRNFEDTNCIPTLEGEETVPGSLPQLYYCSVSQPPSDNFAVEFRIGPGAQRAVRFVAVDPFEYDVHGYTIFLDARWLQVNTAEYGLLWVNQSQVATNDNCEIVPEAPIPPVIARPVLSEDGTCTDFSILSPRNQVAEENAIYSWTGVDEADEYVLIFFNYLSDVSDVISVDGSRTSVEIYTGSLRTGSQLNFDVTAKKDGKILCTTARSGWIKRLAPQATPSPEPTETPEKKDKKKRRGGYTPPSEEEYTPPEEYIPPGE